MISDQEANIRLVIQLRKTLVEFSKILHDLRKHPRQDRSIVERDLKKDIEPILSHYQLLIIGICAYKSAFNDPLVQVRIEIMVIHRYFE